MSQDVPEDAKYRPPPGEKGGVGIVIIKDSNDAYFVTLLMNGSPAQRSGKINPGDRLQSIDHVDVYKNGHMLNLVVSDVIYLGNQMISEPFARD